MSAAMLANNSYFASDSLPPKPASPSSPTMHIHQPQAAARSFMNLAVSEARSQLLQPVKYQQYTPAEPPAGVSYLAFLRTWTDDDVLRWLTEIKCNCHGETFKSNDIRGDILLELDQMTLKEMGIVSIGDRLRILNAVKLLRQRVANKAPTTSALAPTHKSNSSVDYDSKTASEKGDVSGGRSGKSRLENVRPAPLQLNANAHRGDLPAIIREQPDSARSVATNNPPIRPLPLPTQSTPPSVNTPSSSAHSVTPGLRPGLPPLPPPPRGQPPLPPSRVSNRSHNWTASQPEAPSYTSQPPPPPPQSGLLTPSTNNWVNHHLPADPRPGNPGGGKPMARSISPVPPARLRSSNQSNGRTNSGGLNGASPSKRPVGNTHPYANAQAVLHPPTTLATNLSPIDESFSAHQSPPTPSPPTQGYTVGRGPFTSGPSNNQQLSLDDLRRKFVKFVLPDDGHSSTIDVASCTGGVEVLEKVLKKFGRCNPRSDESLDVSHTEEGGLVVDGWGVYMDMGGEDGPGMCSPPLYISLVNRPDFSSTFN